MVVAGVGRRRRVQGGMLGGGVGTGRLACITWACRKGLQGDDCREGGLGEMMWGEPSETRGWRSGNGEEPWHGTVDTRRSHVCLACTR